MKSKLKECQQVQILMKREWCMKYESATLRVIHRKQKDIVRNPVGLKKTKEMHDVYTCKTMIVFSHLFLHNRLIAVALILRVSEWLAMTTESPFPFLNNTKNEMFHANKNHV